jgi:hypothetical protein
MLGLGYVGFNLLCVTNNSKYYAMQSNMPYNLINMKKIAGIEIGFNMMQGPTPQIKLRNIPCAVCHVSTRSTQIMVPGTYECPSGWSPEYSGWLMAEHHGHKRNMFTCVDKDAEIVPGQGANNDGNLLYHVEADCGTGLPCPPYDQRREMSCVVCTK